jgi:deoxyribonucleoside regulator
VLERGIIQVSVNDPVQRNHALENGLKSAYGLQQAVVADADARWDDASLYKVLGKKAATFLPEILPRRGAMGLGCGVTVSETVASFFPGPEWPNLRLVAMMGGWGVQAMERDTNRLIAEFGRKLRCRFHYLLLPALASSAEVLALFLREPQIRLTVDLWDALDAALFSIGPEVSAANFAYLPARGGELEEARAMGGVGDILGRIVNARGEELDIPFNRCLSSIPLRALKNVPVRIGVGGGRAKAACIRAALRSGLITILVTDGETARTLLGETEREGV